MFIRSALALALVATLAAPLSAQGHPRGGGPGMGPHAEAGPMLMRGLNLTEAQRADLKALAAKHREAMKPKHEAAMAAHKALQEAMMNPAATVEQLKALHEKASQVQFELALDRRAMMQESLTLLTPEQKAKAEALRLERQKRWEVGEPGPRRKGMGRGPGAPSEKK
jgi:protein CpxP